MPARGCLGRLPRRPGTRRRSIAPPALLSQPRRRAPGTPRAVAQATGLQGPVCPQTGSLDLPLGVTSGQTGPVGGGGGAVAPRTPAGTAGWTGPGGWVLALPRHLHESARIPWPVAGASERAARPRIYIFPSLGSGVRSCILMRS